MTIELATPDGVWVKPDSKEFLTALGGRNPGYDAVGLAVRNLGFVKKQFSDSVLEITFDPRNAAPLAVDAAQRLLFNFRDARFKITHLDENNKWHSETFESAGAAYHRIDVLSLARKGWQLPKPHG